MIKTFEELEKNYQQEFWKLQNGLITEEKFSNFCMEVLSQLMGENKDVLERLKNI